MQRRNASLLAFRPTRAVTPSQGPSTNGSTAGATAPTGAAVVNRAHLDCPRCQLPITVESLHWQTTQETAPASAEEAERQVVADRYAAIRDGERDYRNVIHDLERRLLREALEESDGVMKDAARILGIKYTTFVAKAHRLGLTSDD